MRVGAFLLALAMALPASAAEPTHCYGPGTAPEDAVDPTDAERIAASGLNFGYHLIPVIYRRACDLTDGSDRAYLARIVSQTGCSARSDLGRNQFAILDRKDALERLAPSLVEAIAEEPGIEPELCAMAETLEYPPTGADNGSSSEEAHRKFIETLVAIETLTTSYRRQD